MPDERYTQDDGFEEFPAEGAYEGQGGPTEYEPYEEVYGDVADELYDTFSPQGGEAYGYDEPAYEELPEEEPVYDVDEPPRRRQAPARPKPAKISANMTINLTCTLSAASGLLGLFFYFAEKQSRAVRRTAVQSIGLFAVVVFISLALFVLGVVLGIVPFIGGFFRGLMFFLWVLVLIGQAVLRVKLMLHAYRGEAYVIPVLGEQFRQFES